MAFQQQTVFPSAARTATPTSVIIDVDNDVATAELIVATSASAVPSTTINVEGQDDTGAWYLILASVAIAANGTIRMIIGPGVVAAANVAVQAVLPKALRVRPVHGNANSHTYSIAYRAR